MNTNPTARNTIKNPSNPPSDRSIGSVLCAKAGTGTASSPLPLLLFHRRTRTFRAPNSISHRLPVKYCGSCFDLSATSAVGGKFDPAPLNRIGTISIRSTSFEALRTWISAIPGITCGTRTVT